MEGVGENKLEDQRWMFAFTHKFDAEDLAMQFCLAMANLKIFDDGEQFHMDIVDILFLLLERALSSTKRFLVFKEM